MAKGPIKFDVFAEAAALGITPKELLSYWLFTDKTLKLSCYFTRGIIIKSKDDIDTVLGLYKTLFLSKKDFMTIIGRVLYVFQTRATTSEVLALLKESGIAEVTIVASSKIDRVKFAADVRRAMPNTEILVDDSNKSEWIKVIFNKTAEPAERRDLVA
jgi:hypothetical protein